MITHQQLHTLEPENLAGLLRTWRKHAPRAGVLMLLPEAEKDRLPGLQRIFQDEQVPLAGAIFPALVSDAGFVTQGAWLICLDPMPVFFLIDDLATDGARRIAAAATPPAGTVPTPQELAPKLQPRSDADVPRPAPPRELGKPADDLRIDIQPKLWHVWQVLAGWMPEADQAITRMGDFVRGLRH